MVRNPDKLKTKFLEALREHGIILIACKKAGLIRSTCYRWIKEDVQFARAVDEAMAEGTDNTTDKALFGLAYLINEKDLGAIRFWLNNRSENFTFPKTIPRRTTTAYKPIQILSTKFNANGVPRTSKLRSQGAKGKR